jgi:uncharacterized protein (DUF1499 family)
LKVFEWEGRGAIARIKGVVETTEAARIVRGRPTYLYAQFQTRWFKFVNDAEFFAERRTKVVHVRSASRIERKDFGVNRARIETTSGQRFASQFIEKPIY